MNTFLYEREFTPFDILVRNFFQDGSKFSPLPESKVQHPIDLYTTETHLVFDIACTGISKDDLEIQIQNNTLRVNYDKSKTEDKGVNYLHRGIAKRSFNLGWKIDSKFDLSKANAEFKYGLLKITIPYAKGSELKTLKIS